MSTFTLVHVVISLVGIASGFVVLAGLLTARRFDTWTAIFLTTTIATSVTGFGFSVDRILPSHIVGVISLVVLAPAVFARYARHLERGWRVAYVITSMVALYLNVFVGIVQAFRTVPALRVLAPTQSEPPFQIVQLATLVLFIALTVASVIRFRVGAGRPGAVLSSPPRSFA